MFYICMVNQYAHSYTNFYIQHLPQKPRDDVQRFPYEDLCKSESRSNYKALDVLELRDLPASASLNAGIKAHHHGQPLLKQLYLE